MKPRIGKIFVIQISAFIIAILIISFLMFNQLAIRDMQRRVTSDFESELEILANELHYKVLIAREKVKALSSRTMIRKKLYSYVRGEISLNELRSYTQPKYVDGASVYADLLTAVRTGVDGTRIAMYEAGEYELPDDLSDQWIMFLEDVDGYHLYIRNTILHENSRIGYDAAVFDLSSLSSSGHSFISDFEIIPRRESNKSLDSYSLSQPIGDIGWYVHGRLSQEVLRREEGNIHTTALLLSGLLIAAVMAVSYFTIFRLTFNLVKERDRINDQLVRSLHDKEYLFRELHHRVKNNLNLIVSFLELQSSDSDNEELVRRNEELRSRINAISLVHEKLQTADSGLDVRIGEYLRDLCRKIIDTSDSERIALSAEVRDTIELPAKSAISIGLIFSELMMNSLKHAAEDNPLNIFIGVYRDEAEYRFTYDDDGAPFPENFSIEDSSSMGLMVVSRLTRQLGGTLEYDASKGKTISLRIPAASET
jgi:two-component sensor histidine kinase